MQQPLNQMNQFVRVHSHGANILPTRRRTNNNSSVSVSIYWICRCIVSHKFIYVFQVILDDQIAQFVTVFLDEDLHFLVYDAF